MVKQLGLSSQTVVTAAIISLIMIAGAPVLAQDHEGKIFLAGYKFEPEVPTSGSGTIMFELRGDTLLLQGSFSDLTSRITSAGIYYGPKGGRGNRLLDLNLDQQQKGSGKVHCSVNTYVLPDEQIRLLKEGMLFVMVRTRKHPQGEIRGQFPPAEG